VQYVTSVPVLKYFWIQSSTRCFDRTSGIHGHPLRGCWARWIDIKKKTRKFMGKA